MGHVPEDGRGGDRIGPIRGRLGLVLSLAAIGLSALSPIRGSGLTALAAASGPSQPTLTVVGTGRNSVSLVWTASTDSRAPLTGYVLTDVSNPPDFTPATTWTFPASYTAYTVHGLAERASYTFSISGVDAVGQGPAGTAVVSIPPSPCCPSRDPGHPWTGGTSVVGPGAALLGADGRYHAYFAEGYTGVNFDTFISILSLTYQTINVTLFLRDGRTIRHRVTPLSNQQVSYSLNDELGPGEEVSASLDAAGPFLVERPMYFNFAGTITGGHDAFGAQTLADTFYFAEGTTIPGFNEYLTVMNPNPAPITVDISYYFSDGSAPSTVTRTIGATSRATYSVNSTTDGVGPGKSISARVSTTAHGAELFLAERPMYFNALGVTGGTDVMGATALTSTGNLAEGNTFFFNREYLTVLSAGTIPCTSLQTTYVYGDGTPSKSRAQPIAPNARTTFLVNDASQAGAGHPVSIHLSCASDPSGTFLAERPMYFNFLGDDGGSDAIAVPDSALAPTAYFAEGSVDVHEYITVLNPNSSDAMATLSYTFLPLHGPDTQRSWRFPAHSRTTIDTNADLGPNYGARHWYWVKVDSNSAALPLLAERALYFAY